MSESLPLSLFDYELPPELIAQEPVRPRDASRLLMLQRSRDAVEHRRFSELPELLSPGDLLVVNRTRVFAARLFGKRPSGGKVELLFVRPLDGAIERACSWEAIGRPGKALEVGARIVVPGGAELYVTERSGELVRLMSPSPVWELLAAHGEVPLPPYIDRDAGRPADRDDYQTVFAREPGAVAAPTAALHFTDEVLARLSERGVERAEVVLHVGPGTFLPVRPEHADDVRNHVMHAERYEVPEAAQRAVRAANAAGRRVIAVGTTTVRALESWWRDGEAAGESRLFITPGYRFGVVDGLLTNFHLPRSTLLMLVSAFAGRERILAAYRTAVTARYRFFSYGDAMLIV